MNTAGLLFLLITHFLAGRGVLSIFKIKENILTLICLSFIIGVVLFSMVPMGLEMMHIPITKKTVVVAICIITAVLFGIRVHKMNYRVFSKIPKFNLRLYELVFICVFIGLMVPSVWRCFYYPPNARDVLSGPEPIAEYTLREHTMVNSVLNIDLMGTNNHLKPPFITGLQIIYKMLVHPFGQLWLSVLVVSFLAWLYYLLRTRIHPVIAGLIMLFFICMPDPYAYTFIILFDYSNMILFFAGAYYLMQFAVKKGMHLFYFSSFLFGLATFIRSETLVLVAMFLPAIIFILFRNGVKVPKIAMHAAIFIFIPFIFYYVWVGIFLKYYMPGQFNLSEQVNNNWSNIGIIFTRMSDVNTQLLFGWATDQIYGYMHYFFLLALIADCIFIRRFNDEAKLMLYAIAVVYIAMPVMAYITPLFDLRNTTKRGLFKLFPLIAMYMANSGVLLKLSETIRNFEFSISTGSETPEPVKVKGNPKKRK